MSATLLRDVLDGDGCLATNAGVEYYEDQYISMYLPYGWTSFAKPYPMGNTSGVFHVDFYPYDNWASPVLRIDGARGSNSYENVHPNGYYWGALAWRCARGLDANGWEVRDLDSVMSHVTGGNMLVYQAGLCGSEEEAGNLADYYSQQVLFRAHIK